MSLRNEEQKDSDEDEDSGVTQEKKLLLSEKRRQFNFLFRPRTRSTSDELDGRVWVSFLFPNAAAGHIRLCRCSGKRLSHLFAQWPREGRLAANSAAARAELHSFSGLKDDLAGREEQMERQLN